ncbi:uroporphyrinogen-III synthase [Staphylococcus agnetis]|uniref:uroporphyrinogen-III synthase n=1 Tax=Staphylococcus agnetis TaxID=985762 RepID=UPI000D03B31F|nr:uroporphyrinogen-III synthase [Staphylococcus agnetis]
MKPNVLMTQTHKFEDARVNIKHLPFLKPVALAFDTRVLASHYDWLIFTSKNAVKFFRPYLQDVSYENVAVIGEKTKQYCDSIGLDVAFYPKDYSQEGFTEMHPFHQKERVLIPSSVKARPKLTATLNSQGIIAIKVDLYDVHIEQQSIQQAMEVIANSEVDAITFASSSAAHAFFSISPPQRPNLYYAIGLQTAKTIHQYGYTCKVAHKQTLESLINKIIEEGSNI